MSNWELAVYDLIPPLPKTEDDRHGYRLLVATAFSLQQACRSLAGIGNDDWSKALRGDTLADAMKNPMKFGVEYDESLALFSSGYYVNNAQTRIHVTLRRLAAHAAHEEVPPGAGVFVGSIRDRLLRVQGIGVADAALAGCVSDLAVAFGWAERIGVESLLPTASRPSGITTIDDAYRDCQLTPAQCAALTCLRSEAWLSCGHQRVTQTVPSAYAVEWVWSYHALKKMALMWALLVQSRALEHGG